jgi:hypothetical protein
VVFELRDGVCRWVDLVWDSHHPGALVLAAHLSAGVAGQFDAAAEEVVVGGDPEAVRRLERLGFSRRATSEAVMEVADPAAVSGARALSEMYLTAADVELLAAEALI